MPGAVVTVFDTIMGPKPIYCCGVAENEASKIAIKSHITFAIHGAGTPQVSGDAVVPIQELGKTAYVYLFRALDQPTTLSYVVDQSVQSSLYKSVHLLKAQAERLADELKKDLEKTNGEKIEKSSQNLLKQWTAELPEFVAVVEEEVLRKITIKRLETEGSFSFLNKILKGDFEKIIGPLIRGETIYVAGDRPMCELAIATLEVFCPQIPKKITWTDSYVPPGKADIVGIPRPLAKVYIGNLVVNLDSGKVEGGQKDPFAKKLVGITKKKSQQEAEEQIQEEMQLLFARANEIVEICKTGSPSDEEFNKFRDAVGGDRYPFIVDIAENIAPHIKDLIPKDVGDRVADFITSI